MRRFAVGVASASALALFAGDAISESIAARPVTHIRGEVHRIIAAVPGSVTLLDQNDDDSGVAVISTNFTHDFDSYDSYGADDFAVPTGHKWKIHGVEVSGTYGENSNPAQSENVLLYRDANGLPGRPVAECDALEGIDNRGSFAIKLPKTCKVALTGGRRYWVSVVANENNACCTVWNWETRNSKNGNAAAWENPGDGFDLGCGTWDVMISCLGDGGEGPDFMFTLKGKDVAQ